MKGACPSSDKSVYSFWGQMILKIPVYNPCSGLPGWNSDGTEPCPCELQQESPVQKEAASTVISARLESEARV